MPSQLLPSSLPYFLTHIQITQNYKELTDISGSPRPVELDSGPYHPWPGGERGQDVDHRPSAEPLDLPAARNKNKQIS